MEPAAQSAQPSVETAEYRPAAHAVHAVPPELDRVSVTDPAAHEMQLAWSLAPWYDPGAQAEQPVSCPPPEYPGSQAQ